MIVANSRVGLEFDNAHVFSITKECKGGGALVKTRKLGSTDSPKLGFKRKELTHILWKKELCHQNRSKSRVNAWFNRLQNDNDTLCVHVLIRLARSRMYSFDQAILCNP